MTLPKQAQIAWAEVVQRSLGTRTAADYLRTRGWSLAAALWILLRARIR